MLWQQSIETSLSPIQIQILLFLQNHAVHMRTVSYLSKEFHLSKATISETIKILNEKKLITKKTDSFDTRSYIIHLSPKGKRIASECSQFSSNLLSTVDILDNTDKQNLLHSLLKIIGHLSKTRVIEDQRMCFSCIHYEINNKAVNHFCHLLNKPLRVMDLRIDCPEHELKKTV